MIPILVRFLDAVVTPAAKGLEVAQCIRKIGPKYSALNVINVHPAPTLFPAVLARMVVALKNLLPRLLPLPCVVETTRHRRRATEDAQSAWSVRRDQGLQHPDSA